jgi:hypothetical protein
MKEMTITKVTELNEKLPTLKFKSWDIKVSTLLSFKKASPNKSFFQIAVFSGSVECGLASFPDLYVRLEEKETLEFIREFAPGGSKDREANKKDNEISG